VRSYAAASAWHKVQRVVELMSTPRDPAYPSTRQETLRRLERELGSLDEIYVCLPRGGLTQTQFQAMRYLAERGSRTLGALVRATGTSASSTTGLVDRLETQHFVQRSHPEEDRRTVTLTVTKTGSHELALLTADRIDELDRKWAGLNDDDLAMVFRHIAAARCITTR
jgi:DNA-binding MarR family transcriptional regulator